MGGRCCVRDEQLQLERHRHDSHGQPPQHATDKRIRTQETFPWQMTSDAALGGSSSGPYNSLQDEKNPGLGVCPLTLCTNFVVHTRPLLAHMMTRSPLIFGGLALHTHLSGERQMQKTDRGHSKLIFFAFLQKRVTHRDAWSNSWELEHGRSSGLVDVCISMQSTVIIRARRRRLPVCQVFLVQMARLLRTFLDTKSA